MSPPVCAVLCEFLPFLASSFLFLVYFLFTLRLPEPPFPLLPYKSCRWVFHVNFLTFVSSLNPAQESLQLYVHSMWHFGEAVRALADISPQAADSIQPHRKKENKIWKKSHRGLKKSSFYCSRLPVFFTHPHLTSGWVSIFLYYFSFFLSFLFLFNPQFIVSIKVILFFFKFHNWP